MTRGEALAGLKAILEEATEYEYSVCYVTNEDKELLETVIFVLEQPERKKGKWNHGLCSVCGYDWGKDAPIANVPSFCPNCGSDNRGEQDD